MGTETLLLACDMLEIEIDENTRFEGVTDEQKRRILSCGHEWQVLAPWHPVYIPSEEGRPLEDGALVSEVVERSFRCFRCAAVFNQVEGVKELR